MIVELFFSGFVSYGGLTVRWVAVNSEVCRHFSSIASFRQYWGKSFPGAGQGKRCLFHVACCRALRSSSFWPCSTLGRRQVPQIRSQPRSSRDGVLFDGLECAIFCCSSCQSTRASLTKVIAQGLTLPERAA